MVTRTTCASSAPIARWTTRAGDAGTWTRETGVYCSVSTPRRDFQVSSPRLRPRPRRRHRHHHRLRPRSRRKTNGEPSEAAQRADADLQLQKGECSFGMTPPPPLPHARPLPLPAGARVSALPLLAPLLLPLPSGSPTAPSFLLPGNPPPPIVHLLPLE